jgi:hypothetical protein
MTLGLFVFLIISVTGGTHLDIYHMGSELGKVVNMTSKASAASHNPNGAGVVLPFPLRKRRRSLQLLVREPCPTVIAPFPQDRRYDKVLHVSKKLIATKSLKQADDYRLRVTDAMSLHLASRGVPACEHPAQIARFWSAVELQSARMQWEKKTD